MHVFIDDSGDPGFRLDSGSSRHFVIACCVFESPDSAERTSQRIRDFKKNLGWPPMEELKFSKTRSEIRFDFLNQICSNDFFVRAIVVDKRVIISDNLITAHKNFYNYIINMVLTHSKGTIRDARVRIDGSGSREYKKAMQSYLKYQSNSSDIRIVRNVNFVNSKGDQLIQLADMIAGSTRRSYDDSRSNSSDYAEALKAVWSQEKSDIWEFK
jgi:hypothetical protein